MITDARSIPAGQVVESDICIIGGGAAGITLALALADRSITVTLLESGGIEPDEATQELNKGRVEGRQYFPLDECRIRRLGGSTNFWGGWCRPLDEVDFAEREWVPCSGWPLTKADLDPFYERAQRVCNLGSYDYNPRSWIGKEHRSLTEDSSSAVTETMFQIFPARFGGMYQPSLRQARNIDLILHGNALEIEMDASHRTTKRVQVATLAGNRFALAARTFVLAAGGIENPRLLLASRRFRRCGVGNDLDLVGRFFSDHLHVNLGQFRPPPGTTTFYSPHRSRGVTVRGGLSLTDAARNGRRLLGSAVTLHNPDNPHDVLRPSRMQSGYESLRILMTAAERRTRPDRLWRHVGNVLTDMPGAVGLSYRKLVAPRVRTFTIGCRAEQAPNPDSRVTLDDSTDRFGVPRAHLHWQLTGADIASFGDTRRIWAAALVNDQGQVSGLRPHDEDAWMNELTAGGHHIGTTRMHRDHRRGVVDEHCRVHGIDNLYLAGSSVFPTAGWAPPTLTIVALALRLADHIQARRL